MFTFKLLAASNLAVVSASEPKEQSMLAGRRTQSFGNSMFGNSGSSGLPSKSKSSSSSRFDMDRMPSSSRNSNSNLSSKSSGIRTKSADDDSNEAVKSTKGSKDSKEEKSNEGKSNEQESKEGSKEGSNEVSNEGSKDDSDETDEMVADPAYKGAVDDWKKEEIEKCKGVHSQWSESYREYYSLMCYHPTKFANNVTQAVNLCKDHKGTTNNPHLQTDCQIYATDLLMSIPGACCFKDDGASALSLVLTALVILLQ